MTSLQKAGKILDNLAVIFCFCWLFFEMIGSILREEMFLKMNIITCNLYIEKVSLCCYTNAYRLLKTLEFPPKIRYEIT